MRSVVLGAVAALLCGAAFAAEPMQLAVGESVMIEPDGTAHMLPAMTGELDPNVKAASQPLDTCVVIMRGEDGQTWIFRDTAMADGTMVCAAIKAMQ